MKIKVGDYGSFGAIVFLDGSQRTFVIEANEEERYIVRFQTDEQGKPMPDAKRENVLTEKLRGDVCVKFEPPWHREGDRVYYERSLKPNLDGGCKYQGH